MIRTQIQLPDDQSEKIRDLARSQGVSMAEVIRRSIDSYLSGRPGDDIRARKERALSAIGRFSSGRGDLSRNHDAYLEDAYE